MRCFLAIELPLKILRKVEALVVEARNAGIVGTFSGPEQLHVTLLFLGEKTDEEVKQIVEKLKGLKFPKFKLAITGAGFFPDESFVKVFWAGAFAEKDELKELHLKAAELLGERGEERFQGHVTIARVKAHKGMDNLRRLKNKLHSEFFGEFEVREIVLKKSELKLSGAEYLAEYSDIEKFALK